MSDNNPRTACLEFCSTTGKLRVVPLVERNEIENKVAYDMACEGFFGGYIRPALNKNEIEITHSFDESKTIPVKTIHISCKSDPFHGNKYKYAGVIIYQYHGKTEWRTANRTHCKAGYVVIQGTDAEKIKKWKGTTDGVVHGAVYRNAFGEEVDTSKVVGEGFSILDGSFKINSGVFNNPTGSEYHDGERQMSVISKHCVGKVVESWKKAGPRTLGCRNFTIKDLMKDY